MKLQMRGGIAAIAIVGSVFIAAGCGGSDSGSSGAAKDAAALDYVPDTAIGYVTINTDFTGEGWTRLGNLAKAFDPEFKPVDEQIAGAAADGEEEVDFQEDVDPWLGESGGAAVLTLGSEPKDDVTPDEAGGVVPDDAEAFVWAEIEDRAAFEKFAESQGFEEGGELGDFTVWTEGENNAAAVDDELVLFAESEEQLKSIVEYDGDSIKDVDGVGDAIDGVEGGDALGTLVISGEGLRAAAKDNDEYKALADADQLKDFNAFALAFSAEENGFRVDGDVAQAEEGDAENIEHPVFMDLPANTVFAVGGYNLGGLAKAGVEGLGTANPDIQQGIGAISAVLGVSLDDLESDVDGEFVIGAAGEDDGIGALAGGVAGAAMGGGTEGLDPSQLLQAGTLILAFEETGKTGETIGKIVGSAGALGGAAAAPKEGTAGDFTTQSVMVQGMPVTFGTSDDVAAVELGADTFEAWGEDTLGESDSFTSAWENADAPDETVSMIWLDAGRIAGLAGLEGGEDAQLGGLVGWSEADGSDYRIGMFLHVEVGE